MSKSSIPLVIFLGLMVTSPVAEAAPAPSVGGPSVGPQEEACKGRTVGAACTLPNQQLGTCATSTCNRLDYSQGSPPKAIEAECLVCQEAGAGPTGPDPGEPPMVGSGGPPSEAEAGGAAEAADSAGSKDPPTSSSRCSVIDERGAASTGSAWSLMLLGLAGLAGLGRRRRSRRAPAS